MIDSHFLFNRPKPQLHTLTPSSLSNRFRGSGGEQQRDGGGMDAMHDGEKHCRLESLDSLTFFAIVELEMC